MRRRPALVQKAGFGKEKRADADSANPSHACRHLAEPCRQRRVSYCSAAETADDKHGITRALDPVEAVTRSKRQHTALALERQTARVGDDLDRVDAPAGKAIDGAEHLQRPDEVELVDWWHDNRDDAPDRWGTARAG